VIALVSRFWWHVLGGLGIVALCLAAVYHRGEDSCILIPECLESSVPLCATVARSDVFFAPSGTHFDRIFNGIPRSCLPSETGLHVLPYRFLGPAAAFILNEAVVRVVALLGMALLLKRHLLPRAPDYFVVGVAVCFALLPFFPCAGLSVAGQPLLIYALANLRSGNLRFANWLIVGLFPFVSLFALSGFVLIGFLALWIAGEWLLRRKIHFALPAAWLLLTGAYLVAEYRLVLAAAGEPDFVPHRVEFALKERSLADAGGMALDNLVRGQYHARAMQAPVILGTCGLAVLAWLVELWRAGSLRVWRDRDRQRRPESVWPVVRLLLAMLALSAVLSLGFALFYWSRTRQAIDATGIELLQGVPFQRVDWLHPLSWALAFGGALVLLLHAVRWGRALALALILLQLLVNLRIGYYEQMRQPMTYREFFSEELFAEIKAFIGKPPEEYRVVSLGMLPGIALQNGFYVLDGYQTIYPLEYKHRFREIIAPELEKDEGLRRHFDDWGSRCYFYSSELKGRFSTKHDEKRRVEHLDVDLHALREMGGAWILAAVEIANAPELGLTLEKAFERDDSPWQIFLYSVPENAPARGELSYSARRDGPHP
jgi:hypothetical protein